MFGLLLVPILEFGSGHHKANKLTHDYDIKFVPSAVNKP